MKSKLLSLTTVALAIASASAGGLRRYLNTDDRTSPAAEGAEPAAPKSEMMSDSKAHKVSSSMPAWGGKSAKVLGNGKSGKKSKGISSAKATKTGVTDDASASGEAVMAKSAKETSAGAKSAKTEIAKDTKIRSDGALGMAAISHINAVVDDSVEDGAKYYEMLGFYPAENADGPMNYPNITNYGFCVDAGFDACRVDIIFLKHEVINLYLELFFYYEPKGDTVIPIKQTNDAGGIRHIAVEVEDAVATYNELKSKDHQGRFITKDTPIPLDPFPYTFFYWVDKYGIQWEFEQGRPVEYYHVAGITG